MAMRTAGLLKSTVRGEVALCVLFAAGVVAFKSTILFVPYYWDEMGWVRGAYWLSSVSLVRAVPGLHAPTAFWGHPTALHASLAALFKLFGRFLWVSRVLIVTFSFVGTYATYKLGTLLSGRTAGVLAAGFLFFSPLYFAQSGMFLGDLPVMAVGAAVTYWALRKRYIAFVLLGAYLVLLKETAGAVAAAIVLYMLLTEPGPLPARVRAALKYSVPLWVLAAFFVWQKIVTGHFCCIYSFTFQPLDFDLRTLPGKAGSITRWLFLYQYRFVLSAIVVASVLATRRVRQRRDLTLCVLVSLLSGYSFCFLYLLPRYLLPALPYLCVAAACSLVTLVRSPTLCWSTGVAVILLQISAIPGNTLWGNGETTMAYRNVVTMHQMMGAYVQQEYPEARVLTVWPFETELSQPVFGYVRTPITTVSFRDGVPLQEFDLLLTSVPSAGPRGALQRYARLNNLRLVKRLARRGAVSELYAKARLPADGIRR